jgi:hypothetical protein
MSFDLYFDSAIHRKALKRKAKELEERSQQIEKQILEILYLVRGL